MKLVDRDIQAYGQTWHIEVSSAVGSAGGVYQMLVNNYYKGSFVKYMNGWAAVIDNNPFPLTSDDIGAILDMINEKEV